MRENRIAGARRLYQRISPMTIDRRTLALCAALGLGASPLMNATPAEAVGCLTGAAAGAVAGHYAGHHTVTGAIGGCIVGHHMAAVARRKREADAAAAKNTPPSPAPTSPATPAAPPAQ